MLRKFFVSEELKVITKEEAWKWLRRKRKEDEKGAERLDEEVLGGQEDDDRRENFSDLESGRE